MLINIYMCVYQRYITLYVYVYYVYKIIYYTLYVCIYFIYMLISKNLMKHENVSLVKDRKENRRNDYM